MLCDCRVEVVGRGRTAGAVSNRTLCAMDDCLNEAREGDICSTHARRRRRGQVMSAPVIERPKSALDRLLESALTYAEAEDDADWDRAIDNVRKSATAYVAKNIAASIRKRLAEMRASGARLGRPRKIGPKDAADAVSSAGSISAAAAKLAISVRTIQRALVRRRHK